MATIKVPTLVEQEGRAEEIWKTFHKVMLLRPLNIVFVCNHSFPFHMIFCCYFFFRSVSFCVCEVEKTKILQVLK